MIFRFENLGKNMIPKDEIPFWERKRKRFVATGKTYPHREEFASWAWYWDADRKAWIEDNGSDVSDMAIQVIMDLPGVEVAVEDVD